jgi:long-chain acyl-CoA synthetase
VVEVRIAEDGELLVENSHVSADYWKNPEATTAAFENRWYHTGDLGYKDGKGKRNES